MISLHCSVGISGVGALEADGSRAFEVIVDWFDCIVLIMILLLIKHNCIYTYITISESVDRRRGIHL